MEIAHSRYAISVARKSGLAVRSAASKTSKNEIRQEETHIPISFMLRCADGREKENQVGQHRNSTAPL